MGRLPFVYQGNLPWLDERTILLVRHGSHAYGTAIATSDLDYKGVAIPPRAYFLGFHQAFEQAELRQPVDAVIYDIRKFFRLACECNPSIIEALHTDPEDLVVSTPAGERLRASGHLFLSRKARHTFSGYAKAQLKRIKGHYSWLMRPPEGPPTRAEFHLPETSTLSPETRDAAFAAIQKQLDRWQVDLSTLEPDARIALENILAERWAAVDEWKLAASHIGLDANFIEALDRERRFKAAQRHWQQYLEWKSKRNPARAALEEKHGFDTKHAAHLVRLLRMAHEIIGEGRVLVRRPDAAELRAIRDGAWSYEALVDYAERMDRALEPLVERSPLPHSPDRAALDRLCIELVEMYL
jgi:predicted nucleotidyltransferase